MITRFISCILLIACVNSCFAAETITVRRGQCEPIALAINKFTILNTTLSGIENNIVSIISNDLKISGFFKPISKSAFIEQKTGIGHNPLFAAWRQINANFLLNGEITKINHSEIKISVVLWDNFLEKHIFAEEFVISAKLWRRVAHKIADKIYEQITGDKGHFDTRIAYVSETGSVLKKVKRIAIMDYDGANHRYLTNGNDLVLTPRFSPKADKILYLSYEGKVPKVHMYDLKNNNELIVGNFIGMSFAPRFAPDGNKGVMSIAKNGATNIFAIDFTNMSTKQLTTGVAINTSPSYSPDGKYIVFNSDRSGSRQLYIMNADGSNVRRISFGGGNYATPSWSPRGDYIAFTKITRDLGFTIGLMKVDDINADFSDTERIIASGYLVEGPTWAPSGRMIIFAKSSPPNYKGMESLIYSIDITGFNERIIKTPYNASDPDWSMSLD